MFRSTAGVGPYGGKVAGTLYTAIFRIARRAVLAEGKTESAFMLRNCYKTNAGGFIWISV